MKLAFSAFIISILLSTVLICESFESLQPDLKSLPHTFQQNFFHNHIIGLSPDSSDLEFFPLAIGNVYEWRDLFVGQLHGWRVIDTVKIDGFIYFELTGSLPKTIQNHYYIRIDASGRVLSYGSSCSYYDSLYQWENIGNNVSFYRLFQKSGDVWVHCNMELGLLTWPPYFAKLVSKSQNEMEFKSGMKEVNDTSWGFQYVLRRGIGIIFEEYEADGYSLTGARINGVVYGQLVLDVDNPNALPQTPTLGQNYPNPFSGSSLGNSKTEIPYSIPYGTNAKLSVFDALGREVAVLVDGFREAGNYSVSFNAQNHPRGVYYYRLATKDKTITNKMVLLE